MHALHILDSLDMKCAKAYIYMGSIETEYSKNHWIIQTALQIVFMYESNEIVNKYGI